MEHLNPTLVNETLEQKGYLLIEGGLSMATIEAAREWIQNHTQNEVDPRLQPAYEQTGPESRSKPLRKIRRLAFYDPTFWSSWCREAGLTEFVNRALGKQFALILHACFLKPRHDGSEVVPHQDQALWDHPYPNALTIWIALEPAHTRNGCIKLYLDSHQLGPLPHVPLSGSHWHHGVDVTNNTFHEKEMEMNVGDMLMWHRYMLHGSGANHSDKDRVGMVMVFADTSQPDFSSHDVLHLT